MQGHILSVGGDALNLTVTVFFFSKRLTIVGQLFSSGQRVQTIFAHRTVESRHHCGAHRHTLVLRFSLQLRKFLQLFAPSFSHFFLLILCYIFLCFW